MTRRNEHKLDEQQLQNHIDNFYTDIAVCSNSKGSKRIRWWPEARAFKFQIMQNSNVEKFTDDLSEAIKTYEEI